MRKHLRRYVQLVADTIEIKEPIFEFGSLQVHEDSELEDLRPLFRGKTYVGCDMRPGPGVDRVLNLHQLDLPDGTIGTAICMDTMEHVEYPRQAISELYRILKPGGALILSSVMNFPIHGYPKDYWRFTPEGFRSLLKIFDYSAVGFSGPENFPDSIVAVAFKGEKPNLQQYETAYLAWKTRCNRIAASIRNDNLKID